MMKLKLKRISMGLKQGQLAEQVGICKQYLADLENGRANNPSKKLMEKIASALETTAAELFFSDTKANV